MELSNQTFRVNFSSEGIAKLKELVKDKLKEVMGDYTDDTLVEYVVVLLNNGRNQEEAGKELHVFLGDDSASFVSWLWNHLSSHLDYYMRKPESSLGKGSKIKPITEDNIGGKNKSHKEKNNDFLDSDNKTKSPTKEPRSRRSREWRLRDEDEPASLKATLINENFLPEEHTKSVTSRRSPKMQTWQDEQATTSKREAHSRLAMDVPRRLLQFAVRDAVGTSNRHPIKHEPKLKRLRSVISTVSDDSVMDDLPHKKLHITRVSLAAVKAAAEAAEDAVKVQGSRNVFNRLSKSIDVSYPNFRQREHLKEIEKKMQTDSGLAYNSASDDDGFDDVSVIRHGDLDASESSSQVDKDDNSFTVQYSVAENSDELSRKPKIKNLNPSPTNASRKIVNISVNVNTWEPPSYQAPQEVMETETHRAIQGAHAGPEKPDIQLLKYGSDAKTSGKNETSTLDNQKESQKLLPSALGSHTISRPSEGIDSRTVFVNNVHFAATKDTLSRHFNKCGDVLKVIILTDPATGQPKGSAYVEFMRKESAELALSLSGTSFMSRILKVVRRSDANQEGSSWPHLIKSSRFSLRHIKSSFPRGISMPFHSPRLPVKPGARSLQWKRNTTSTPTGGVINNPNSVSTLANNVLSPRNLTYVRTEIKPNTNQAST